MRKTSTVRRLIAASLLAGTALALAPAMPAFADPDDGGGRAYPCGKGQFWYPQFNSCVSQCKPGFDHINSADVCDKIPVEYRFRVAEERPREA